MKASDADSSAARRSGPTTAIRNTWNIRWNPGVRIEPLDAQGEARNADGARGRQRSPPAAPMTPEQFVRRMKSLSACRFPSCQQPARTAVEFGAMKRRIRRDPPWRAADGEITRVVVIGQRPLSSEEKPDALSNAGKVARTSRTIGATGPLCGPTRSPDPVDPRAARACHGRRGARDENAFQPLLREGGDIAGLFWLSRGK